MRGAPRVWMIEPRVRAGFDGHKPISPLIVGQRPPCAREIWIERRRVIVDAMRIPARGIRLPDLHERVGNRTRILIQHAPLYDDSFSLRFALVLPREIAVAGVEPSVRINRSRQLRECMGNDDERLFRVAQRRASISW